MKVKIKSLQRYLRKNELTVGDLARAMGVSADEIEKMLDGKAVGVNTARKFIRYFSADEAQAMIDWDAIGKKNPLACDADEDSTDEDFEDEYEQDSIDDLFVEDYYYSSGDKMDDEDYFYDRDDEDDDE